AALLSLSASASAVSLQPNTPTSDADIVYRGGPADELPSAVAAGRFNGDPYDDALMCSWANNSCWLFYGGASSNRVFRQGDVVFVGPSGGFGGSATFLGDVNGDGYQDIAIGAPWTAGAGTAVQGGSLWVFFGRAGTVSGSVGYYDANLMVFSTQSFARLGASASAAGDMNGDGIDDFWVSAPLYNGSAGAQGSLFLFLGKRSFPPSINETSAALVIEGIEPPAAGGHVLLGKRDLNRDGRPDLVVSSASYADATGAAAGAAHVFLGPLPRARAVLSTADADVSIWGTSSVPSLGSSLAFAENFTRGGAPTLVVGADYREESPGVGGAVYLFNSSQFVCCLLLHTWDADGLIYSTEAGDGAGRALATGDFDGDGWVDLAIGAPGAANARGELVGRAYLLYGNTTGRGPVQVSNATGWVNGPHNGSQFGRLLVALHLNDDGKADFLAGAPMAREPSGTNGAAYSFFGRLRNRAPVASIDVVANATEGDVLLAAVNLSDMDDDRLSWVWSLGAGGSPGDHTNASFVELRFPNEGTYTILLEVFDGELYVVAQATIVVANAPPECEIRAVTAFVEGAEGTLAVNLSDPGGDQLSFSWFGPPGLEPSNRSAYYTPPRGQGFEVRVGVVDDAGASSVCTLAVPVENVPPTVSITAPGVVYEGDWVQLGAVAQDPGGYDEFTLTWSTPEGTAAGGALEWFARTPGFWGFDVEATDMDGGSGTAQVVLRVIGRAPQVDLLVPTGVFEGDAVNLTVEQVRGWEYDTLTFTWSVCRYGTQLNAQPTFAIARAAPGRFCVYVHVSDEDGDVVELEGSLNVANRAPLDGLRVSPEPPFAEDQELTFTPVLSRFETSAPEEIKYNWTVNGVLIDWGRVFRAYLPSGDHKVTVEATDPDGGVSRLSLRIIIENVPPLVAIVGPTEVQPGALSRWLASASDPSGGAVEVEWEVDGVRSTMGKELEWSSRTAGPHVIRVYATDTGGAVASASITVEVLGPPTVGAGIDLSWIGLVVGASAAFAAGIVLGAYVLDRLRNRRKVDELWKR
ncbi:MAG TPA: PKD domain-containing protein, partial [Candidatus Thermoplasmatota archaeon]